MSEGWKDQLKTSWGNKGSGDDRQPKLQLSSNSVSTSSNPTNLAPKGSEDDSILEIVDNQKNLSLRSQMHEKQSVEQMQNPASLLAPASPNQLTVKSQPRLSSWRNRNLHVTTTENSNISSSTDVNGLCETEDLCNSNSSIETPLTDPILRFEDMLTLSPRKISFVFGNYSNHKINPSERGEDVQRADCEYEKKEEAEPHACGIADSVYTSELDSTEAASAALPLLGVCVGRNETTKQFEIQQVTLETTKRAQLLPSQLAILLMPGDILESVNGVSCRRSQNVNELIQRIRQEMLKKESIKLTFVCPPKSDHSRFLKDRQTNGVQQIILVTGRECDSDIDFSDSASNPTNPHNPKDFFVKCFSKKRPNYHSPILHIDSIPSSNWLEQTCARSNDVLLSVNGMPTYEMNPEDASLLLETMVQTRPFVDIKLYTPPLTRWESMRKVAVATAGGALVGTGAVIMATPLHPIGHAMAIGGLGVLGTEFEAPRKVFSKMASVVRRRSSNSEQQQPPPLHQEQIKQ